jgi:hypothetical protein
LGDDGVIVEIRDDDGAVAFCWRDPLRVSTTLAADFPELGTSRARARALPGDARQRTEMTVRATRSAPVAALVWIQQGPADHMVRLPPTEALVDLVRESAWVLIADGHARAHLECLRRLVIDVPSYRLTHSPRQLHCIAETLLAAQP